MNIYDEIDGDPIHIGKSVTDNAIIIPCYDEYSLLVNHIKFLNLQSIHAFYAIIVLSNKMDTGKAIEAVKATEFPILILKRSHDTGSAGGFFLGAKTAYANGAKTVIFADVDALPEDKDLVESLINESSSGHKIVMSTSKLTFEGKIVAFEHVLNQYTLVSRDLIEKVGFHYAPAYLGADDAEYQTRLFAHTKPKYIPQGAKHPQMDFGSRDFGRSVSYAVNLALLGIPTKALYYIYFFGIVSPMFFVFGQSGCREAAISAIDCELFNKFGIAAYSAFPKKEWIIASDVKDAANISPTEENGHYKYESGISDKIINLISLTKTIAGHNVVFSRTNLLTLLAGVSLARQTWILKEDGKKYLLSDNSSIPLYVGKIMLAAILIPAGLLAAAIFLPLNVLRKPKTARYGLN